MAYEHCPNCGCNLKQAGPLAYGNVTIDDLGEIVFQGHTIRMPKRQHDLVEALIQARGRCLTRSLLATITEGDIYDQTISKYVERARIKFREIDPSFDQIVAIRGYGAYRWEFRDAGTVTMTTH